MRLPHPFYRFPFRFDAERLHQEVSQIPEEEWIPHPQHYTGNDALILVSVQGQDNHSTIGAMKPTERLAKLPYIQQIMQHFNTTIGRSRLMRLAPNSSVPPHSDVKYYWKHHLRLHVPIQTTPSVSFRCRDTVVHMGPGEAWAFDNWSQHSVQNSSSETRVHLVIDTVGSPHLWKQLRENCHKPSTSPTITAPMLIPFVPERKATLRFERHNGSIVRHPSEVAEIISDIKTEIPSLAPDVQQTLVELQVAWRAHWTEQGFAPAGYSDILKNHLHLLKNTAGSVVLPSNGILLTKLLSAQLTPSTTSAVPIPTIHFDRPVFIVAAPRSGSTMLYEALENNLDFWTIGGESHSVIEGIPSLRPENRDFHSNVLTAHDATVEISNKIKLRFLREARHPLRGKLSDIAAKQRPKRIRFLEKTPKNALRIAFLRRIFPEARFVYLYRRPEANVSSILNGWRSGRFVMYPDLPNWPAKTPWSFLLPQNWRSVSNASLAQIAWFQYTAANDSIQTALREIPTEQVFTVEYDDFLQRRTENIKALCQFCDIPFGKRMNDLCTKATLPLSRYTVDRPSEDKWKSNLSELQPLLSDMQTYIQQLRSLYPPSA